MLVVGLLIGLAIGAGVAWLIVRAQYAARVAVLEDGKAAIGETMKALAADALAT